MKNKMRVTLLAGLTVALVLVWCPPAESKTVNYAKVTYITGKAYKSKRENGSWSTLRNGHTVYGGYYIKTAKTGKVELTLPDGSQLRLAPNSKLFLESAQFTNSTPTRRYRARINYGRVYTRATPSRNRKSTFTVRSNTAVAGIRGTAFNTILLPDGSTRVRCFEGEVFVATWADYAQRYLSEPQKVDPNVIWDAPVVEGPSVISEEEWVRVAQAMMSVTVGADGTLQDPTAMDSDDMDEWEEWNRKRDGQ